MSTTLDVVVGAQFGSEGKGHVCAQIIQRSLKNQRTVTNIRVAGPNAGHCVVDNNGIKFALRTIPVGAALQDDVRLYIAPGSEIEMAVLEHEVKILRDAGHTVEHLFIADEATILTNTHKGTEVEMGMQARMGSTNKGIGACRADRIMRTADRVKDNPGVLQRLASLGATVVDGARWIQECLNTWYGAIVIEGTQGYGLGLHAGRYPQCTSSDTRGIDFLAMAGINPWDRLVSDPAIWAVARVYPIRVAGNSGPLLDETSWADLGLQEELTTVTHKVRRVGGWDAQLVADAVRANGGPPTVRVALTMADQKIPGLAGFAGYLDDQKLGIQTADMLDLAALVSQVERDAGATVDLITTSDRTALWA
jgi:adenylosuccinate synthase